MSFKRRLLDTPSVTAASPDAPVADVSRIGTFLSEVSDEVSIDAAAVRLNKVMKFLVVSHRGTVSVPDEELAENRREWGVWMETLDEQSGLRPSAGKTISAGGVADYAGDSAGVSIIEANSLDEALARVRSCPGLPYGWAFDVLYE